MAKLKRMISKSYLEHVPPTLLPDGTIIMMRIVAEARVEQMKETGEVGGIGVNLRIVEGWHIGICLPHSRVVTTQ
jgi:hypothetical protein